MTRLTDDDLNPECRRSKMVDAFETHYGAKPQLGARSPGRVDLMGSHTDYNEGFVLTLPIDRDTWMMASPLAEKVELYSLNLDTSCQYSLLSQEKVSGWGVYIQAVTKILQEAGYPVAGFQGVVHGTVPIGSGLSSSASIEATVATLLEQLCGFSLTGLEKAKLCQKAENQWVGVNCGILDQYSSILGKEGEAISLDCRSLTHEQVSVPDHWSLVICNTCAPRQLSGSEYGERRAQCEEGAAFFARVDSSIQTLRDVPLELFHEHRSKLDTNVQKRAQFIIEENARVFALATALKSNDANAVEEICEASFVGARDLFEISVPAMQAMFDSMNEAPGRVGCRQAGAGFGGCMVALVEAQQVDAFCEHVSKTYHESSGIAPEVYAVQTAAGAGTLKIS